MCGIVGALAFKTGNYQVRSAPLAAMRDVMAHRGPDGAGIWVDPQGRVGLGHRRLSIIDLSQVAGQPMPNEDESIWVTFNGEIYNHAEVRAELERLGGHRWRTNHSDTEVLIHAYEEWGVDAIHRFRGMFAFAIWDANKRQLWLARDRAGIKPLYLYRDGQRLLFASEIKALLEDQNVPRRIDEESFFHYLSFLTVPAPKTLFAGIEKLPPASWMLVQENGSTTVRQYWDALADAADLGNASDAELAQRTLEELRTSVQLHGVSDVPVGVFLSGGIDSSTNAALFSEGRSAPVETFSIGYQGDYQSYRSELDFARLVVKQVGAIGHEKLLCEEDLLEFLPRMVWLQDEPIADPVCVPVYYVSKLARDAGVIVCQVGEGADELFWGYPAWKRALQIQNLDNLPTPRFFKAAVKLALDHSGRQFGNPREWLRRSLSHQPVFWGGAESFADAEKRFLLAPELRRKFADLTSWDALQPIHDRYLRHRRSKHPLDWMTYLDLNLRLPELLLMRVDKMSMGVSLETRVPFLDHKFVEFAMGIPAAAKTRRGTLKTLLKQAVRGVIPDTVIDRPKQGFGVPIHEWFFSRLGAAARVELDHFCRETGLLDPSSVDVLFQSGDRAKVWCLLNVAMWWRTFLANAPSASLRRSA